MEAGLTASKQQIHVRRQELQQKSGLLGRKSEKLKQRHTLVLEPWVCKILRLPRPPALPEIGMWTATPARPRLSKPGSGGYAKGLLRTFDTGDDRKALEKHDGREPGKKKIHGASVVIRKTLVI
ncbi:MAG: hypothetical protein Q9211_001661 [Gyalolechia sp. 1 TL-2023]